MAEQTFEEFVEHLLSILKDRRKELGLTQGELGERVGRPQSAVARLESGTIKDPHISMVFDFCAALELKVGDLTSQAQNAGVSKIKSAHDFRKIFASLELRMQSVEPKKIEAIANMINSLEKLI